MAARSQDQTDDDDTGIPELEGWLMVSAVAGLAGLSRQYVMMQALDGVLQTACRLGRTVVIAESEAKAWVEYREARMKDPGFDTDHPEVFPNPRLGRSMENLPPLKGYTIISDIASQAGTSKQFLQRQAVAGRFKTVRRMGRCIVVKTTEARSYLAQREARLAAAAS